MPDINNFTEEGFILALISRYQTIVAGRARWNREVHIIVNRKWPQQDIAPVTKLLQLGLTSYF
jgi:hypothetical protein